MYGMVWYGTTVCSQKRYAGSTTSECVRTDFGITLTLTHVTK
jgi:hypothetical protein